AYSGEGEMTRFYGIDSPYNSDVFKGKNDPITLLNAFNISHNITTNLIEYAAKSKLPGSGLTGPRLVNEALGKEIGLYYKAFKLGGVVIDGIYISNQVIELVDKYRNHNITTQAVGHHTLNILMTVIGYDGWLGYGISAAYFILDAAYGKNIWDTNINHNTQGKNDNK
ncbi:MAG: hypothetical protein K2M10_10460, partial [Muribaculaceae bacterium]|nr:hypothetical protein [Muribaculaceae bacterium]